jgi:hypothetical protein
MNIPTWAEYEEKCGHPVTEAEYARYIRMAYKDQLDELEANPE